ncbi:MAG: sulfatase-like hydrolase/transferase [Alphaproteobacteria bacterium]|nr:sulfatase-like hydrolase/transferase [Alphaproteobacteria bacterium]
MNRKKFLKNSLSAIAGVWSGMWTPPSLWAGGKAPAIIHKRRPNILFILMDQERSWADLPAGLDLPQRRNFAETALSFNQYHVNAIACGPSRSVIYTGQHIQKTRVFDNPGMAPGRQDLDPVLTPTIGNLLKTQGYHTAYIGKWHLHKFGAKERDNLCFALKPFGFEEYIPPIPEGDTDGAAWEGAMHDAAVARRSAEWFKRQTSTDGDKPWYLAVNLINPHDIRHFNATGTQADTLHPHFASDLAGLPAADLYQTDLGYGLPESFPGADKRPVDAHRLFVEDAAYFFGSIPREDTAAWQRYQNYYFNCLRDVDRHIGTILDSLEKSGQSENTIVVFTSDHGEMAGAHGLRGKGPFLYKENFRVPLLIRHPDLAAGGNTDRLACSLDLVPTLLSAAGMDEDARRSQYPALKGYDLLAGMSDRSGPRDATVFMSNIVHCCNPVNKKYIIDTLYARDRGEKVDPFRFPEDFITFGNRSFMRGVFDGRYKFGRYFRPDQHHVPENWETLVKYNDLELYDTAKDLQEMNNIAGEPGNKELILRLNQKLNSLLEDEAGKDLGAFMPGAPERWRL